MGTLYVVATPIGNLSDLTPRAARILGEVGLIAAEDTRHSGQLLHGLGITTPMVSYHSFNERARRDLLLGELAKHDVALVTDAGTPAISDPGVDLVAAAHDAGFTVTPVPGPSAMVAAVSASGLVPGPFVMLGFLSRKASERASELGRVATTALPLCIFESPFRLVATLRYLRGALGDRPAVVGRELTKLHEEVRRGHLSELAEWYDAHPPKGEIVIVVGAATEAPGTEDDTDGVLRSMLAAGMPISQVAREAARVTGHSRSDLYDRVRKLRGAEGGPDQTPTMDQ